MGKKLNHLTTNDESQIITQYKVSPLKESITKSLKKKRIHLNQTETDQILYLISREKTFQEIQKEYPNLSQTKYYDLKNTKPLKKDKLKEIHNHVAKFIIQKLQSDHDNQKLLKIENGFDLKNKISKLVREYFQKNQINERLNIRNTKKKIREEVFRLIARDGVEFKQHIEESQIDQQFNDLISQQIVQITPPKGVKKSSKDPHIRGRIIRLKKEKQTIKQIREELNIDFPNSTIRSIKKPQCQFKYLQFISEISNKFDIFFENLKEFHIVGQIIGPTNDIRNLRTFIKNIISPQLRSRKRAPLLQKDTQNCLTTIYRITKQLCKQFINYFYPEPKPEIFQEVNKQLFIENAALQYLQNFTDYDLEDEASKEKLRTNLKKLIKNWCSDEHSIFKHLKLNQISLEQQGLAFFKVYENITGEIALQFGGCKVEQKLCVDREMINNDDETETEDDDVGEQQIRNYSKYKYGYPLED